MATSMVPPAQSAPESFLATSRTLALGLVWGGVMLFILGWWLGVKHEELSRLVVFTVWVLAAVAFACGVWQFLALGRPAPSSEQKHADLLRQRKVLSAVVLAGGLILVALAVYLAASFGLAAF